MNGNSMMGGVNGFMQGWRFGREMVEGDELDRKARAAAIAAQEASSANAFTEMAKYDRDQLKEQGRADRANASLEETRAYHRQLGSNADREFGLRQNQFDQSKTQYEAGAPMREAQLANEQLKNQETQLKVQKSKEDDAYIKARQTDLKEFEDYWSGKLAPDRTKAWDATIGIAAQDPRPAKAALQSILPKAAELMKQGRLDDVRSLWASPEGKQAMSAWAPAYQSSKGSTVEGGRYVIQDVQPNRLEPVNGGQGMAMILDVGIAPSKQFAEELTRQRAAAKTPEEIARIDRQLAPSTYQAPLTEGRVAVSDGGQPRIFSREEFAAGISNLNKRIAFHEQNPKVVEDLRRRLLARASGTGVSDSLKAEAKLEGDMYQEQARLVDQDLKRQGLDLRIQAQKDKASGKDNSLQVIKMKQAGVDKATQLPKTWDAENGLWKVDPELVTRRNGVNARAKDIISENPSISITDALKQADSEAPSPQSEVDRRMADIFQQQSKQAAPAEQGMSSTGNIDGMTRAVVGPDGKSATAVFRNGGWVIQR